jgi:hypothetical protein
VGFTCTQNGVRLFLFATIREIMPQTRLDKKIRTRAGIVVVSMFVAALAGAAICIAAVQRHSIGLWIEVGILIGAIAVPGIGYSIWIIDCYRYGGLRTAIQGFARLSFGSLVFRRQK